MLRITYCSTNDEMEKHIISTYSIKDITLFSHYQPDINLVNKVCEYLDITHVQLISIKLV